MGEGGNWKPTWCNRKTRVVAHGPRHKVLYQTTCLLSGFYRIHMRSTEQPCGWCPAETITVLLNPYCFFCNTSDRLILISAFFNSVVIPCNDKFKNDIGLCQYKVALSWWRFVQDTDASWLISFIVSLIMYSIWWCLSPFALVPRPAVHSCFEVWCINLELIHFV